ncbi:Kinesin light chain [Blastocystis sp. ATCC 50177/Nand II]|uniref:Kinesin light chain n=1 Tax=Blastocystis sp. subtype 1 (strain ATCC 50177 / NandII) TaxID=478820 RepID=A0A196S7Y3_BLAHN|nr:Kinesin light chain [Blastocystis sp. ATCC 50177/Nand II]
MFGLAKSLCRMEAAALHSAWKGVAFPRSIMSVRAYTQGAVRRRFLIPYVYRSKSFNIHTENNKGNAAPAVKRPGDLPETNDNPHPYTDFEDLEIDNYIATDEKTHKQFMDIESQISEKQAQINELYEKQDYEKGLVVAQEALALIKSHFGENHPVYACGLNNLALMYKSLEDYDEAALFYDKALQIYEDTCGKSHKSTLTTLKNLAILYQTRADAEGGLDRFEYMLKAEDVLQDIEDRKKS